MVLRQSGDSCEVRKQIRTQMKSRRYNGSSTPSIRSRRYSETRKQAIADFKAQWLR
jgi:hypothetical protein